MSAALVVPECRVPSDTAFVALLRRNAVVIQAVFATFWAVRFALLEGPWEVPIIVALVAAAASRRAFRYTAPLRAREQFRTAEGRLFMRPVTIMTVIQLAVSIVLPAFGGVLGRDDLTLAVVAITIGIFLMFFATPLRLAAVRWIGLTYTLAVVVLVPLSRDDTLNALVSATSAAALLGCTLVAAAAARNTAISAPAISISAPPRSVMGQPHRLSPKR